MSEHTLKAIEACSPERLSSSAGKRKALVVVTIIEIRPFRNGWQVYEYLGVQTVFLNQKQAITYAQGRACFRSGEIRVLAPSGNVQRTIAFSEADRLL